MGVSVIFSAFLFVIVQNEFVHARLRIELFYFYAFLRRIAIFITVFGVDNYLIPVPKFSICGIFAFHVFFHFYIFILYTF